MRVTPQPWSWHEAAPAARSLPHRLQAEIWLARRPAPPSVLATLLPLLSADERGKLARFHRQEDRERFLIGRGVLRRLLGARLRLPPGEVAFVYGPWGKPTLAPEHAPHSAIHFNVSHSGDLILIALAGHPIGIDVEEVRPEMEWRDLVASVFPAGADPDGPSTPPASAIQFFRAWTRREAALKAVGTGLGGDGPPPRAALSLVDLDLPPGYQGAVALTRAPQVPVMPVSGFDTATTRRVRPFPLADDSGAAAREAI